MSKGVFVVLSVFQKTWGGTMGVFILEGSSVKRCIWGLIPVLGVINDAGSRGGVLFGDFAAVQPLFPLLCADICL